MDRNMTNLTFIDDKSFEQKVEDGKNILKDAINNNAQLMDLINLNISIQYGLEKIKDLKIEKIIFDPSNINFVFSCDKQQEQQIKKIFLETIASCIDDANNNFNKYKLNKYFLIPIGFEVKTRTPEHHLQYLINSIIECSKKQIVFDLNKKAWEYDGTVMSAYNLFKKHIFTKSDNEINEIVNSQLKKING